MRPRFLPILLLLALGAISLQAQTCKKTDPPPLNLLFPEEVDGLEGRLHQTLGGCYTYLYQPEAMDDTTPWAVVMIEPHSDPFLGEDADALAAHYEERGVNVHRVEEWPVALTDSKVGIEWITLRDSLRVSVVVKNTDDEAAARALADRFFRRILPGLPCGG